MTATALDLLLLVLGLCGVTLVARNLFLVLPARWQPRGWMEQALRVAPVAALLAITVPEVARDLGLHGAPWQDPRLMSALTLVAAVAMGARALLALAVSAAVFIGLTLALQG